MSIEERLSALEAAFQAHLEVKPPESMVSRAYHDRVVDVLRAERDAALKERDTWKANHDNAVSIKRAVLDRPDLQERAKAILALKDKIFILAQAMHRISLTSQNSMCVKEDCGRIARQALKDSEKLSSDEGIPGSPEAER
jgi:hypothetical protein